MTCLTIRGTIYLSRETPSTVSRASINIPRMPLREFDMKAFQLSHHLERLFFVIRIV